MTNLYTRILTILSLSLMLTACTTSPYVSDITWTPVSILGVNEDAQPYKTPYLKIINQSTMTGFTGRAPFEGRFVVHDGGRTDSGYFLTSEQMAAHKEKDSSEQYEQAFLTALTNTSIVSIRDGELLMMTSKGTVLMRLKPLK